MTERLWWSVCVKRSCSTFFIFFSCTACFFVGFTFWRGRLPTWGCPCKKVSRLILKKRNDISSCVCLRSGIFLICLQSLELRSVCSDKHSRICLRVEIFLASCRYKATIDRSAQLLIEFGMRAVTTWRVWKFEPLAKKQSLAVEKA